jgi:hypothetical protein
MKYRILRDFRGSQDGRTVTEFKAGTEVEISDHLAPHVAAWAEPVGGEIQNKAVITDPAPRKPRAMAAIRNAEATPS